MAQQSTDYLNILAVTLVDVRRAIDHGKRTVVNAQSSIEQFRHTSDRQSCEDVERCIEELVDAANQLRESLIAGQKLVVTLLALLPEVQNAEPAKVREG